MLRTKPPDSKIGVLFQNDDFGTEPGRIRPWTRRSITLMESGAVGMDGDDPPIDAKTLSRTGQIFPASLLRRYR
jgi:hypothetical protein